jgi:hypothetical protein
MLQSNAKYSSPSVDDIFPKASPGMRHSLHSPEVSSSFKNVGGSEKLSSFAKEFLKEHQKFIS